MQRPVRGVCFAVLTKLTNTPCKLYHSYSRRSSRRPVEGEMARATGPWGKRPWDRRTRLWYVGHDSGRFSSPCRGFGRTYESYDVVTRVSRTPHSTPCLNKLDSGPPQRRERSGVELASTLWPQDARTPLADDDWDCANLAMIVATLPPRRSPASETSLGQRPASVGRHGLRSGSDRQRLDARVATYRHPVLPADGDGVVSVWEHGFRLVISG